MTDYVGTKIEYVKPGPGEFAFGVASVGKNFGTLTTSITNVFLDPFAPGYDTHTYFAQPYSVTPVTSDPDTWIVLVMHLPDAASPVTHFDIEGRYNCFRYMPRYLRMEASTDGEVWDETWSNIGGEPLDANETWNTDNHWNPWVSDGVQAKATNRTLGTGFTFPATGRDEPATPIEFAYYRMWVALIEGGSGAMDMKQIALYSEDGLRQNLDLAMPEPFSAPRTVAATDLAEGQAGYGPAAAGRSIVAVSTYYGVPDLPALFNGDGRYAVTWQQAPAAADPSTWIPIDMHLRAGHAPVTHFDLQAMYWEGTGRHFPSRMKWEASVDGVTWTEIWNNVEGDALNPASTGYSQWVSDGKAHGSELRPCKSTTLNFSHARPPAETCDQLAHVRSVQVSAGAALVANAPLPIAGLRVDAADAGTIDGFAFAPEGTIDVVNAGGVSELPGTYANCTGLANVAGWTLTIAGLPTQGARIVVSDGKLRLLRSATVVIFR